jgi:hypothetical protein
VQEEPTGGAAHSDADLDEPARVPFRIGKRMIRGVGNQSMGGFKNIVKVVRRFWFQSIRRGDGVGSFCGRRRTA